MSQSEKSDACLHLQRASGYSFSSSFTLLGNSGFNRISYLRFFQALDVYIPLSLEVYTAILLLPLILVNFIRNLKFLAPCSTIANCITFVGFGIILYYIFRQPLTFEGRSTVGRVEDFPLFFGTVLFALEAIGVVSNNCESIQLICEIYKVNKITHINLHSICNYVIDLPWIFLRAQY